MLPLVASAKKSNSGSKCLGPAELTTYVGFSTGKSLTAKFLTIRNDPDYQSPLRNVSACPKMHVSLHIITTSSSNRRVSMTNAVRNDQKAVFADFFHFFENNVFFCFFKSRAVYNKENDS